MEFSEVLGLTQIKSHLKATTDHGRIPHAQLFIGNHGSGTLPMALAYTCYILSNAPANLTKASLEHPDLHFCYPVANNKSVKSKAKAKDFTKEWFEFIRETPYGSLFDWYQKLGIENKQGEIRLNDAKEIARDLSLKSYSGGYKIMLIWHAEKMNSKSANHLLKLIEEPPEKTLFILITEDENQIIKTIRSRCQKLEFPPLGELDIRRALETTHHLSADDAQKIAFQSDGSYSKALELINSSTHEALFEEWFIKWVRTAFLARGNKSSILPLLAWAEEISKTGRETQKKFLKYCLNFFRQALLTNYKADSLVYLEPQSKNFELEKFAPFVHGNNITAINAEINKAIYHITRNGNSKMILSDLSISLTHLLHKKP